MYRLDVFITVGLISSGTSPPSTSICWLWLSGIGEGISHGCLAILTH